MSDEEYGSEFLRLTGMTLATAEEAEVAMLPEG